MKKLSFILVMTFIITTIFSANVAALNVGDKLGNVLYSDIKTYINGERIPCYNIDGNIAVVVGDLNNYGFDTKWDSKTRTTTITSNGAKKVTPMKVEDNNKEVGSVAFPYVYTDIKAIINGKEVDSYNINGALCIRMSSLSAFGEYVWDGKARTINLTTTVKVKFSEYTALITKAERTQVQNPTKAGNVAGVQVWFAYDADSAGHGGFLINSSVGKIGEIIGDIKLKDKTGTVYACTTTGTNQGIKFENGNFSFDAKLVTEIFAQFVVPDNVKIEDLSLITKDQTIPLKNYAK